MIENQMQITSEEQIGVVLDDAAEHLDHRQLSALPYLAHGMTVPKVAELINVSPREITEWKTDNFPFQAALVRLAAVIGKWHSQQIQLLALKAWDVMWVILGQDYDSLSEKERAEVARTARFVISSIAPDHSTRHVTHELISPELNISEGTVGVLARRIKELQDGPKDVVEGEFKQEAIPSVFVCAPDTDFGIVNYDKEEEKYQCHICGEWKSEFIQQIENSHGMTREQYVEIFHIEDAVSEW